MRRQMELSDRLQAVAGLVTAGNVACDVGCDHGFVSIYLAERGISPRVIAMDVNRGPLQTARGHIGEYGLAELIETRLSDGVEALAAGEADTLICAGMGGRLMLRILEEGGEKVRLMKEMILQPQSELQEVRKYLRSRGHTVAEERMVLEAGKYYPVMRILPSGRTEGQTGRADEEKNEVRLRIEDKYGPVLLRKKDPVLQDFLQKEKRICRQILEGLQAGGSRQESRRKEILERLEDIERALRLYI
ncbi:MAG: class I SAM-dependent methyltransferase [Lachnospiraceae bacterium]|nr:class I SAM-dependent methyltransferase [Lachnospiraceae bacterium]